jgi:hypothetical protein
MPDGTTNIIGQAETRIKIIEITQVDPYLKALVAFVPDKREKDLATDALMRAVLALLEKVVRLSPSVPEDVYVAAMNATDPGALADLIASAMTLEIPKRQEILETLNPSERLQRISILLAQELDVLELQTKIHNQVQEEVDKSRFEYGRYGAPTQLALEAKLAALYHAEDAVVTSSGMAAIVNVLLSFLRSGDELVMTSETYRRTRVFSERFLARLKVRAVFAEPAADGQRRAERSDRETP